MCVCEVCGGVATVTSSIYLNLVVQVIPTGCVKLDS